MGYLAMQEIMKCFTEEAVEKTLNEIPSGMERSTNVWK